MFRFAAAGIVALLTASVGVGQEPPAKQEPRYRFEKGERLTLVLKQKMHVKVDEVPEAFRELLPEDPFDSDFEGEARFEVKGVNDKGSATLEGRFEKIKAKGSLLKKAFDYAYDRARDGEPKGGDDHQERGPDPGKLFSRLAGSQVQIQIDPRGRIRGTDGEDEQTSLLFALAGLTGQFPEGKIGPGDTWKESQRITLPQLPFKVRVASENTFEKVEKVGDAECAFVRGKLSVGSEDGGKKEEQELPFEIKFEGEGKGLMRFDVKAGRPLDNETTLDMKLTVKVPDLESGEETELKGTFKVEQKLEMRKAE